MEEMDASRTYEITSWMSILEGLPLDELDLSVAIKSSYMAGASGVSAAALAGDDEQAIIRYPFCSTPASDTAGQPNKRRGSPSVGRNEKRIKSLTNGGDKISNEETQCLLFSCHSGGGTGGNVRENPACTENVQQISSFKIDGAKHKVFLSHSGAQKDFVEQLCVDLEARGYIFPFFDKRHHSLPKGKDFVPFIKKAAQQCHVAVIVLSEKYLCSKWPMIELAEFHAAQQAGNQQLNMLPLFYKLAVDDLDDRSIEDRWMPRWRQLAEDDRRIDVKKWGAAVRALRKVNGHVYGKHTATEVGYRKEVVRSIFRLSPPGLLYGSSRDMVGYDRLCEIATSRFMKDASVGAAVMGLYGTTGRGKTTLCKALCDRFSAEFLGRVCHVELGERSRMKRQRVMLESLCGIERKILDRLMDIRQGLELMRDHVHREPVFLAIDNVTGDESSLREAREYLKVGFHPKSRILITSRGKANVQELLSGGEFCMAMPRLRVKEAGEIFLRSAAPMKSISELTDEERRIVAVCIEQCLFDAEVLEVWCEPDMEEKQLLSDSDLYWSRWRSFHPLALSALGEFFRRYISNTHMLRWKDHLGKSEDPLEDVWSSPKYGIGRMIGLQFSSLHSSEQLLFMDIALYTQNIFLLDSEKSRWLEWLSELHDVDVPVMERQLEDLTRFGMINEDLTRYDEYDEIANDPVPTLYRKFAKWYAIEHGMEGLKDSWGMRQSSGDAQNRHSPLSDLVRLRVFDLSRESARLLAGKTMQELHNLKVLQLLCSSCPNLTDLDLQGLDSLRHFELVGFEKLVTVTLCGSSLRNAGICQSLRSVLLKDLDSLTHGPDLRSCMCLHWLRVSGCPKLTNLEQISQCPSLKDLDLKWLVPQQWASLPIIELLPTLHYFYLGTNGIVIDAVETPECGLGFMVAELLRRLRSVRVDDSSLVRDQNWFTIEWNRRGCDRVRLTSQQWEW